MANVYRLYIVPILPLCTVYSEPFFAVMYSNGTAIRINKFFSISDAPHAPGFSGRINRADSISFTITPSNFDLPSLCIRHYSIVGKHKIGGMSSSVTVMNPDIKSVAPIHVTLDDFNLCEATYTFSATPITDVGFNSTSRSKVLHLPSIHFPSEYYTLYCGSLTSSSFP